MTTAKINEIEELAKAVNPKDDYYHDLKVFENEAIDDFAQEMTPQTALELIATIRKMRAALEFMASDKFSHSHIEDNEFGEEVRTKYIGPMTYANKFLRDIGVGK